VLKRSESNSLPLCSCDFPVGLHRRPLEGPIRRTREGGSEWEPIQILLEGDEGSNKTNTAYKTHYPNQPSPRSHWSATEPRNQLPTSQTRERSGTPTSSPLTNTGQTGEHHRSDRSLLVRLDDFHRKASHRSGRRNAPVRPVLDRKPPNHQTGLPTSKLTQTRNCCNIGQ
jgi:hypothetical protein